VSGTAIGLSASFNGTSVFSASATATTANFTRYITTVSALNGANTLTFNFTSTDRNNGTYVVDDVSLVKIAAPSNVKLQGPLSSPTTNTSTFTNQFNQQNSNLSPVSPTSSNSRISSIVAAYADERRVAEAYAAMDAATARPTKTVGNWQAWAAVSGAGVTSPASSGSSITSRSGGLMVALQYLGFADTTTGVAVGGAGSNWSAGDGSGSGDSRTLMLTGFANHWIGNSYVSGIVSAGHMWARSNRTDLTNGETFSSRFEANSVGGRLELGHQFKFEKFDVTPYVAGQFVAAFLPDFTESAVNAAAGNAAVISRGRATTTRSELGSAVSVPLAANVTATGKLAWAHDVNSSNVAAGFLVSPTSSVVADTSYIPKDFVLVSSGVQWFLTRSLNLAVRFDGQFAQGYRGYAGSSTLTYALN
jgi:uncharacterized protein with beta-barrel porin domain